MKSTDFLFTPNRSQERPLAIPPDDIPYTEIPMRVAELKPKADALGVIPTNESINTIEQLQESRAPVRPATPSFENRQGELNASTFDVKDLELTKQSESVNKSADERDSANTLQSLEALVHQFNLNIT